MRHAYRSARRRRWGRYEPSPVLLVTEDDRTLYLGAVGRMLWRYRSELAPLTAALILLLTGAWAHSHNSGCRSPRRPSQPRSRPFSRYRRPGCPHG